MILISDIGSCHNGKLEYAKEAIDLAAEAGVNIIKFQLFEGNMNGNIELPRKWWPELVEYAKGKIDIFASCFDEEGIQLLHDTGIKKVKLAYSQAFNLKLIRKAKKLGMKIWASGNSINYPGYADVKLFCIPEYPTKNNLKFSCPTHPDDNYSDDYDGFSSHYLGYKQDLENIKLTKWEYLEKHMTLDRDDINCPDHWFALMPKELKEMRKCLKKS